MNTLFRAVAGTSVLAFCVSAQTPDREGVTFELAVPPIAAAPAEDVVVFNHQAVPPPGEMGRRVAVERNATVEFIGSEFGIAGPVVKGAPYTADAVNESIQTLADGNRITRKTTTSIARDGEGRTRREMAAGAIGPFPASESDAWRIVYIHDPVTGVSYTLNESDKTARKLPGRAMMFTRAAPAGRPAAANQAVRSEQIVVAEHHAGVMMEKIRVAGSDGKNVRTESLGKRNIEGVEAEGTRTVHRIEAGEIGNERPIEVVSERWYSPELQTVLLTRHSDPRVGDTIYRLENVRRGEPARSLFEVPAAYTIVSEPAPNFKLRNGPR